MKHLSNIQFQRSPAWSPSNVSIYQVCQPRTWYDSSNQIKGIFFLFFNHALNPFRNIFSYTVNALVWLKWQILILEPILIFKRFFYVSAKFLKVAVIEDITKTISEKPSVGNQHFNWKRDYWFWEASRAQNISARPPKIMFVGVYFQR